MTIMNIGTNNYRVAWFKTPIFGYTKVMVGMWNGWNNKYEVVEEYKLYSDNNAEIVTFAKEKVLEINNGFEDDYSVSTKATFMKELKAAHIDGETNAFNDELTSSTEETADTPEPVSTEETAATEENSCAADIVNTKKSAKRRARKEKTYKGLTKRELIDKIATARAATTATKNVQMWESLLRTYPIESKVTPGFSLAYEYDHLFA